MARKNAFCAKTLENCENSYLTYLNGNYAISPGDESESDTSFDDHDTYGSDSDSDSHKDNNQGDVDNNTTGSEGLLWLGFMKNPKKNSSLCRHSFPNKAGGTPAWLDPIHLPTGKSFLCDFCERPLQFLLQVNAPIIGSEFAHHRTIFVFICPSMACLNKDQHEQKMKAEEAVSRSVKVFRCQLPLKNPFYECEDDYNNECSDQSQHEAPLCSWCGTWKGDKQCSGCRKARYCSKTHQLNHWQRHKIDCIRLSNSHLHNGESSAKNAKAASNTIWPEYKIELECRGLKAESSEFKDAGDSLSSIQGTDEHMNSILEGFNDDDKKKSLASFQKNMLKDPAQVLRCWLSDGKPLWPELCGRPCTTDIPKCNYCHGPLQFEFQIMPQLLYYMGVDQKDDPFEKSLDWATIAIYTCEASCDSVVIYKEEFPWVQLYESVSNLTE